MTEPNRLVPNDLTPRLSVVVPTRNRAASLERTLAALARQSLAPAYFEVIVVANHCSDDTAARVRSLAVPFELRLIELPTPGMSQARNAGAQLARGDLLVFIDDDIECVPGFLEARLQAHAEHDCLVAVGPLLLPAAPQPPNFVSQRLRDTDAGFAGYLAACEPPLDWFCMTGGNCSMPVSLFRRAGGFDSAIVTYGSEDYELGCRLQQHGAGFLFLAEAGGYHHRDPSGSLREYLRQARSSGRNDARLAPRHPQLLSRLKLGLALQPRSALGRLGRWLAFDHPRLGAVLTSALIGTAPGLEWLGARRTWDRLVDGLYEYRYFRGVADVVGNRAALATYLSVRCAPALVRRAADTD